MTTPKDEQLRLEISRVFSSCVSVLFTDGETAMVSVADWPQPVTYRIDTALEVLKDQPDGAGATEIGDAYVCYILEQSGAFVEE